MRYSMIAMGFALMLPASVALSRESAAVPRDPEWDMIAFEMKSWGEPIGSWRLLSNGGGSWTETVKAENAQLGEYDLVWHEIEPRVQNYVELEGLMRSLPESIPDSNDCDNFMTDLPYGTLRLTRGAVTTEITWNSGCLDEQYLAFLDPIRAANELVEGLGKAAPVLRTESHCRDK